MAWGRKSSQDPLQLPPPAHRQNPGELREAGEPSEFGEKDDAEGREGHNKTWVIWEEARGTNANDQRLRRSYTLAKSLF